MAGPEMRLGLRFRPKLGVAALALGFAMAACSGEPPGSVDATRTIASGDFLTAAWVGSHVVAEERVGGTGFKTRLVEVESDGSVRPIQLVMKEDACPGGNTGLPVALDEESFAFVVECLGQSRDDYFVHVGSFVDRDAPRLFSEPFPFLPGPLAVDPKREFVIGARDSLLCASLAWLSEDGLKTLPIRVLTDRGEWSLDFESQTGEECLGGRATSPAISAEGNLAFFASAPGTDGFARLQDPWNIVVVAKSGLTAEPVGPSIQDPIDLAWSPVRDCLAFSGSIRGGEKGTWVLSIGSGQPQLISNAIIGGLSWSPAGTSILGVTREEGSPTSRLVQIDTSC